MRLLDAWSTLDDLKQSLFETQDAAVLLRISVAHASKLLERLGKSNLLVRLARGRWAFPKKIELLAVPEFLTTPLPSCISLQSALYYHGMISQIPSVVYAVSLARTRRYKTPLGVFSIHHLKWVL